LTATRYSSLFVDYLLKNCAKKHRTNLNVDRQLAAIS